ncbi:hypothetical protein HFO07_00365 [Rhizobium leguminosarum]|uniref:hypothetical protein n=1 Tax=Rhizobium leguminosarum TaxID=384 RepID=UPI001C96D6FA|nr:hypothetical protein [Rhizobium leguminosarum]MBY5755133.1 hypothetical protein [Rhizobium leguminosarum]
MADVTTTATIIMQVTSKTAAHFARHVLDRVALENPGKHDADDEHAGRDEDRVARRADIERPDITAPRVFSDAQRTL